MLDKSGADVAKKFHDLLFANQPSEEGPFPSKDDLVALAGQAGADADELKTRSTTATGLDWAADATERRATCGVDSTPTVLLDGRAVHRTAGPSTIWQRTCSRRFSDPMTTGDTWSARHEFIQGLPKAELHVHHVGSASARIVSELATRHPGTVPSDLDELRRFYEFRDFAHFIEVYLAVVALIRTPEDIHYLTYEVAREMATEQTPAVRRAHLHAVHLGPAGPARRGHGRSRPTPRRSRPPGSRRSATSGWCCAGSTTSPASSASRPPTRPSTTP